MQQESIMEFTAAERYANEGELEDWQARTLEQVKERILSKDYPCIFTKTGYQYKHLQISFVEDPFAESDIRNALGSIQEFIQNVESIESEQSASMEALLLCVRCSELLPDDEPKAVWSLLNGFLRLDSSEWPAGIPRDPEDPDWAFCLFGRRAFVTALTPSHRLRHSRNIGAHMVVLFQLRDGIEFVAPYNKKGDQVREKIRKRIEAYDEVPLALNMTTHGESGNKDWSQFWLGDGLQGGEDRCPLYHDRSK